MIVISQSSAYKYFNKHKSYETAFLPLNKLFHIIESSYLPEFSLQVGLAPFSLGCKLNKGIKCIRYN